MNGNKQFWLILVLLLIGGVTCWWCIFQAGGKKPLFTFGEDTTLVTEPLSPDGYVDYVSALNQRLGEGVTPEDNAYVVIVQALGPRPDGGMMPTEFYRWLGIREPPKAGEYFIQRNTYLKNQVGIESPQDRIEILARQEPAVERPWQAADHPELARWLDANEKPLAVVAGATTRPGYFVPLVPWRVKGELGFLVGALLSGVQISRDLGWALAARAMLRTGEGDFDGAWEDLLTCHRLGRLVSRGGTLVESFIGFAVDNIARKADLAYLGHANLSAQQIRERMADLRALPPFARVADKVDLTERFTALNAVMVLDKGEADILLTGSRSPLTGKVNWDSALRNINRMYDRMADACREQDRTARAELLADINAEIVAARPTKGKPGVLDALFTTRRTRGERIGNILMGMYQPALDRVIQSIDINEQHRRNLHIAFALAAYRHDRGQYPDSLDRLVPEYLDALPDDLFTGEPLRYRPTEKGYLLYSVGVNGKDDNGVGREEDATADDLKVIMPPPTP